MALPANSRVRIRYANQYHEATLLQIIPERESVSLTFDNGVTKELKWSSIVWNAGPPTGPGTIVEVPVANGQSVASTSNLTLPVSTQLRPQAPPAPPRNTIAQHLPYPNNGSGAFPQHSGKVPRGYHAPIGHPYYGQPYPQSQPPPGAPYAGYPSHPYPTPSSSSNSTPSYNRPIHFMHYQPPPQKSDPNATVNAYYRPRPALDVEARMQQMAHHPQYTPASHDLQHLPLSRAPLSPISPTRDSSTKLQGDAPAPTKPATSKNESPVAIQLPTPQQNGDTPP